MDAKSDRNNREGLLRVAPKPKMAIPDSFFEFPIPFEETTDFITPSDRLFTLAHLGVPQVELESWSFDLAGLIGVPKSIRYEDLQNFESTSVLTVHKCAGGPLEPTIPFRTVANVEWRGVLLRDILQQANVLPSCKYIWAYGLDYGTYNEGAYSSPYQEHYVQDLPIDYVMSENVLIATHMNGQPLSLKHGFPARLVAPGYYGNNSVKWLCRIEASDRRADGHFTKELYNDPTPDGSGTKPVWEIEPESLIVSPANDSVQRTSKVEIWGWSWSSVEVSSVEISTNGGESWESAVVDKRQDASWQRFKYEWTPQEPGHYEVMSRAIDHTGRSQPMDGARNAVHKVALVVEKG